MLSGLFYFMVSWKYFLEDCEKSRIFIFSLEITIQLYTIQML